MLSFAFCTAVARIVPFSKLVWCLRAMLIFSYFLAAFVIEAVFRGKGGHVSMTPCRIHTFSPVAHSPSTG